MRKTITPPGSLQSRHPLLVLPYLVLVILSFSFSIVALTSNAWVRSAYYLDSDYGYQVAGYFSRGPFGQCQVNITDQTDPTVSVLPTFCSPSKGCDVNDPYDDSPFLCQQMHFWADILIAGSVFAGIAMLTAIFLVASLFARAARVRHRGGPDEGRASRHGGDGAGEREGDNNTAVRLEQSNKDTREATGLPPDDAAPERRPHDGQNGRISSRRRLLRLHEERWFELGLSYTTAAFLLLSILFIAVPSLWLLQLMANDEKPSGDDTVTLTIPTNNYSHWMWQKPGVVYAFLSWFPSVLGILLFVPMAVGFGEWFGGRRGAYRAVALLEEEK